MENTIGSRFKRAWNAFLNRSPTQWVSSSSGGYSRRPDRPRLTGGNERSIVTSIFNRIALDVASVGMKHCKLDEEGRYVEDINSGLNACLTLEANIDQTAQAFVQDIVLSMFDEGCVGMVPVDTTSNPTISSSYDILTMRTGKIIEWHPSTVKVRVYNDRTGEKEDVILPKRSVGIIENPLYAVVNEHNSTMQRLIRKLRLLDVTDERTASGKLDLVIQLPYVVKSDTRRDQAEKRRNDLEDQLANSTYGVAYIDGTEKVTQLNRPVENNLMKQIEYLTNEVYTQLSMSQGVLDGTADEKTMLNYQNRIVGVILDAIVTEMKRKFLSKTARTQGQSIMYFMDHFKLVPVSELAEIADKLTRNEIMTSNEIRQKIGLKPSKDPKADQLVNSNISQPTDRQKESSDKPENLDEGGNSQNG